MSDSEPSGSEEREAFEDAERDYYTSSDPDIQSEIRRDGEDLSNEDLEGI